MQRDKEFFERVKRLRVPSELQALNATLPDYYGEKVKSLSDYRKWIRKQREYLAKSLGGQNKKLIHCWKWIFLIIDLLFFAQPEDPRDVKLVLRKRPAAPSSV